MRRTIVILTAVLLAIAVPATAGASSAAPTSTDIDVGPGPSPAECDAANLDLCETAPLAEGAEGRAVLHLQALLTLKRLYRGPLDGVFDRRVAVAVATFHKAVGAPRSDLETRWLAVSNWRADPPSEVFAAADWAALHAFEPTPPKDRPDQPDRIETDVGRQLLYLILDGRVDAIVHVSTGYDPYDTPRTTNTANGSRLYHHHPYNGWSPKPGLWSIYKFWAYLGRDNNYGIHGYRDVPYYPASHGCTRVTVWDMDYLDVRFYLGMPIHVWDE